MSQARAAYNYALQQNGIVKKTVPRGTSVAASYTSRVVIQDPKLELYKDDTPLKSDKWYNVFTGTQPGVYQSYVRAALQSIGIPGEVHKSYDNLDQAKQEYLRACEQKRIEKVTGVLS
ncbi:hypothetical protein CPB85DRAFT_1436948 [Mucidula mucida]|nr:hypothetical protein CPB85DRAFT_1436948 [Mucidula mucida]